MNTMDWTLAQNFNAVLTHGSLTAAARALGQSQPTVGRRIRELEAQIGTDLFHRHPHGLAPTDAAKRLAPIAESMALAAAQFAGEAASDDLAVRGTVRLTASNVVSQYILPDLISDLRRAHPEIQVDLVPSDSTENLLFRDADIAIRMYRPEQKDLIVKHILDAPIRLYAATSYLKTLSSLPSPDDLDKLDFVGFDKHDQIIRTMRDLGIAVDREFFPVRCDDQTAYWQLVRAGCGIGGILAAVGDGDQKVKRILPGIDLPSLPVWLAAPAALRSSNRIRIVWNHLNENLKRRFSA